VVGGPGCANSELGMGGSVAGTSVVLGVGISGIVAASEDDDLKIEKKTKHPKRQVANKPGRDVV
jgi:hypothetical protein